MPRINFKKVDDVRESGPLPAGTYLCRLDDVEVDETRHGDEMWKLRFEVVAGPHERRCIWDNMVFSNTAMPRAKLICGCLGLDVTDTLDVTPETLLGRTCQVMVDIEDYEDQNGNPRRRNSVPFAGYKQTDNEEATGAGAHGVVPSDGNGAHAEDVHAEDDIPF